MLTSEKRPVGLWLPVVHFVLAVLVGIGVLLIINYFGGEKMVANAGGMEVSLLNYLGIILLPMIGGVGAASAWYKRDGMRPASGRAWMVAAVCTLILCALPVLHVAFTWSSMPDYARQDMKSLGLIILAGFFAFFLLSIRVFLWAGFRAAENDIARKEKLAAKKRAKQGR